MQKRASPFLANRPDQVRANNKNKSPGASKSGVLPSTRRMLRRQPRFEEVDGLRVPLGGVNGYIGVRGKQGRKKNKF